MTDQETELDLGADGMSTEVDQGVADADPLDLTPELEDDAAGDDAEPGTETETETAPA